uniref:Uncharacterized protein n=1 Tax=Odontella aurita TaxID=265563 RepID=A0A7S4KCS2_9STRA
MQLDSGPSPAVRPFCLFAVGAGRRAPRATFVAVESLSSSRSLGIGFALTSGPPCSNLVRTLGGLRRKRKNERGVEMPHCVAKAFSASSRTAPRSTYRRSNR